MCRLGSYWNPLVPLGTAISSMLHILQALTIVNGGLLWLTTQYPFGGDVSPFLPMRSSVRLLGPGQRLDSSLILAGHALNKRLMDA
jgi:hypothetical protein